MMLRFIGFNERREASSSSPPLVPGLASMSCSMWRKA